jgi:hypothetical protein
MKSEPKAFASLSSGLLARKGAARPAMRPQGFSQGSGNLEDLGWNDMGFEAPKPSSTPLREVQATEDIPAPRVPFAGLTPLESPVHSQQAELVDRLSAKAEYIAESEPELEPEASHAEPDLAMAVDAEPVFEEPTTYTESAFEPVIDDAVVAFAPSAPQFAVARKSPQAPRRAPKQRSATGSSGKAAFTLRLDPERHLKLRLACAVDGRSAQQLVTDALDQFLAGMPELDAMAARAKRKGS